MSQKPISSSPRRPAPQARDPALIHLLLVECARRGESITAMARHLGVTYERVAQWRRGEGQVRNARREVLRAAANYLSCAPVYVLVLAGVVDVHDFVFPSSFSARERLRHDLSVMRCDPRFAGLIPNELEEASQGVQMFVVQLYCEATGYPKADAFAGWARALQLAAAGDSSARDELAQRGGEARNDAGLF